MKNTAKKSNTAKKVAETKKTKTTQTMPEACIPGKFLKEMETPPNTGIETDKELFDHNKYGEGWIGMAKHVSEMSGLQRQLFEDCLMSAGGDILAPHDSTNMPGTPAQYAVSYIKQGMKCTYDEALSLSGSFEDLGFSKNFVDLIFKKYADKPIAETVETFKFFADEAKKEEKPQTEEAMPPENEPDELNLAEKNAEEEKPASGSGISYHKIGDGIPDKTWFEKQPLWFQAKAKEIETADLAKLKTISQDLFKVQGSLIPIWKAVLWNMVNLYKGEAYAKISLSANAKNLFAMIKKINNPSKASQMLFKYGKGEITFADFPEPISREELDYLWYVVKQEKNKLVRNNPFTAIKKDENPFDSIANPI